MLPSCWHHAMELMDSSARRRVKKGAPPGFTVPVYLQNNTLTCFTGCSSCRTKKVKCDDNTPKCGRCVRLQLHCEWVPLGPSIRERRRGFGSVKTRVSWKPKIILPNAPTASAEFVHDTFSPVAITSADDAAHCAVTTAENLCTEDSNGDWVSPRAQALYDPSSWTCAVGNLAVDPSAMYAVEGFDLELVSHISVDNVRSLFPGSTTVGQIEPTMIYPLYPPLSCQYVALSDSLVLAPLEHEELAHYLTAFCARRTTKQTSWSTFGVFLWIALNQPMIMHLLLAVSFSQPSMLHGDPTTARYMSRKHFHEGARCFVDAMSKDSEPDHVTLMVGFFFIYFYKTHCCAYPDLYGLSKLSLATRTHVKKYDLSNLCTEAPPSIVQRPEYFQGAWSASQSLLARLLIFLLYADIKLSFCGYGGSFASYMVDNPEITDRVYEVSRTALELNWGIDYPNSQVIDDIENSMIMDMTYHVNILCQRINNCYQVGSIKGGQQAEEIAMQLSKIEQVSLVFMRPF